MPATQTAATEPTYTPQTFRVEMDDSFSLGLAVKLYDGDELVATKLPATARDLARFEYLARAANAGR